MKGALNNFDVVKIVEILITLRWEQQEEDGAIIKRKIRKTTQKIEFTFRVCSSLIADFASLLASSQFLHPFIGVLTQSSMFQESKSIFTAAL